MSKLPSEGAIAHRGHGATWSEIQQQPSVWPTTVQLVRDSVKRLGLSSRLNGARALLTGAGTSAYAAAAIASGWSGARSVPSTDLLVATETYMKDVDVLVSLGRSGDSPESLAVVERVRRLYPKVWHLAITCNSGGALANSPSITPIVLDPRTNDQSLVMTGSFSNLVLAGLCLANRDLVEPVVTYVCGEALLRLASIEEQVSRLASNLEDRVVLLASAPLFSWAREGALKILEMSAGKFPVLAETFLGLRHGPMSFVRPDTIVFCLLSSDHSRRRYEEDLIRELRTKDLGLRVGICTGQADSLFHETIPALLPSTPDSLRTPFEILSIQLLGYHLCRRIGLDPDNPSPDGVITRVVQGIKIHPD